MQAGNIKGALLEYIVRNLFESCGFTNVQPDGLYTYERGPIFFINGKGAAHDADVIMNPPIQMPFAYPTQLIFECKAYGPKTGMTIVRNAYGLRNDVNEFEIVTKEFLKARKNNSRPALAVEERRRFFFQVGVASINDFTKPAIEFALNNRIPLLSLSWFLNQSIIDNFNRLDQNIINSFDEAEINNLYKYLKHRGGNLNHDDYLLAKALLTRDNILGDIVTFSNHTKKQRMFVALLETWDMIFLFLKSDVSAFSNNRNRFDLRGQIHWSTDNPRLWNLSVLRDSDGLTAFEFNFYVPRRIFKIWEESNLNSKAALTLKQQNFSRIFIFNKDTDSQLPFSMISIDKNWLEGLIQQETES